MKFRHSTPEERIAAGLASYALETRKRKDGLSAKAILTDLQPEFSATRFSEPELRQLLQLLAKGTCWSKAFVSLHDGEGKAVVEDESVVASEELSFRDASVQLIFSVNSHQKTYHIAVHHNSQSKARHS